MINDNKRPFLRPGLWYITRRPEITVERHGCIVQSEYALSDSDIQRLIKVIDLCTALTLETRHISIVVSDLGRNQVGMQILGQCSIGYLDIELAPRLFSAYRTDPREFMPVLQRKNVSVLAYVLMHEFGHARDFRKTSMSRWEQGRCPGNLAIDGREQYAECFTEWHLTKGRTADPPTLWYAQRNQWRTQW